MAAPTTFGVIGSGWRCASFLRLARAAPDRLRAGIARTQCPPHELYRAYVGRLGPWFAAEDSRGCTAQMWIVDGGWM